MATWAALDLDTYRRLSWMATWAALDIDTYRSLLDGHMGCIRYRYIQETLGWPHGSHHIQKGLHMNTIIGIIRRNFEHLDKTTFMLLYRSLVRPHLEVSNLAWFPILKQDIDTIEDVQRRATRQLPGFRDLDYEQRLRLLGLPSLTYRRLRGDMIETFKIINGHYDPEVAPVIPKCLSSTRGHNKKLNKRRANRLNCRKYYFTLRVVSIWNDLPEEVVTARNVDTFKRRLDKHWRNHPSKYCYQNNPYSHLA